MNRINEICVVPGFLDMWVTDVIAASSGCRRYDRGNGALIAALPSAIRNTFGWGWSSVYPKYCPASAG